jgi:hypothetical protein
MGTASGPVNFARAGSPNPYKIKGGSAQSFFFGDAVRIGIGADADGAGYLIPWTQGDGSTATKILAGIFVGCEYYSTSQKKTVYNNYFPGSDAANDVAAYVVDDPTSLWMVQCGSTNATIVNLGQTVDIASTPSGNTTTGISGMFLNNTFTTSNVLPFKVVNLVTSPPGVNGTDTTTGFNNVIVAFNNQIYKALLGV